jgi:VIT1/CCC1 family predicted Fe2+/Mn2+ transporter
VEQERITYIRSFVFGVEDSLVSTVGLLSGVAIAGMGVREIFITGIVLIFVEAISMAAGSFVSETSAEEAATGSDRLSRRSYRSSVVMFFSYFLSGFVPLFPYLFFDISTAFWVSIILSLLALIILGTISGAISKTRLVPNALRMLVVGGLAIAVGVAVGTFVGP